MKSRHSPSSPRPVEWQTVQKHFRYAIKWWDAPHTKNYKRALNYGAALWKALVKRTLIMGARVSDIDNRLWLATAVRLWRDCNIEPGSTLSIDDWGAICEWLDSDPHQISEYLECRPEGIHRYRGDTFILLAFRRKSTCEWWMRGERSDIDAWKISWGHTAMLRLGTTQRLGQTCFIC